ncbi:RNA polymerase II elongation factor Ell isoform X1 [Plutella xylostella]|uniref:RNA polymerase II elongation factor Ell isoform X1 n=1 Tax=Plutella xylostella TaxID=51655 RepID=UPI0020331C30|nr:RNA polymerase II elongation factor Ell isoform X1 [Plutella xylostella]
MAALPAGVQYGLSSEQSKENKELVFVKLTDSALKAIEDFLRNNRDKLAKPKIQFLPGNEGKISIPAGGNGSTGEATFHFSINSNAEMEGPQGSFECVRSGGARRLESCGPLPRRMRVQANDDSYEATKDRMARTVAAEQSKCTRVIKPNQTDIGRRVKVGRPTHPIYSAPAAAPDRPDHRPDHRPERPETRPEHRPEHRPERPVVAPPAPRPAPPQPVHPPVQTHQPQKPPSNPDLTRRSIKERLIQLLALKPFKKPELYARLNSEGIKEKERGLVNKILPQIGSLKDNCYHLRRHIWNDVNEDWPFYTEEEKRTLKRRKPQNLTPPASSDSANSLSPRASPSATKRANGPTVVGEEPPAAKKQRISHYRRPDARAGGSPSSGYATGGSGASSGERHASDNEDERTAADLYRPLAKSFSSLPESVPQENPLVLNLNPKEERAKPLAKKDNGYTLSFNTIKDLCPSPVPKANGFRNSPPVEQTSITEKDITNTEPLENTELTSVPDENMTDLEELARQYPPITCASMRRAYKNEFASLYTEYRALYGKVARVAELFTRLEEKLRRAQPHSPDHQSIEQRIVEEYRRVRGDATYQQQRRRVEFLHRKLTHMKQAVHHYDHTRNLKPERVSNASTTQAY